jgi:DNA-binding MarR family transcriptional regulator
LIVEAGIDKMVLMMYNSYMNEVEPITGRYPLHLLLGLLQAGKALEARIDSLLAELGLSSAKWSALRQLTKSGDGLSLGQLAEQLSCVKSNVTQLIDRLEADNLVQRVPDPADRRSIRAELTAEGRANYEAGLRIIQTFERQLLSEFNPEEQDLLARLFSKLGSAEQVRA